MTDEAVAELLTLTCTVSDSGAIRWFNSAGLLHRVHGPALIHTNGTRYWMQNGMRHRADGPAVIWYDGTVNWYWNDTRLSEQLWKRRVRQYNAALVKSQQRECSEELTTG